jgi:hypothetical protein
LLTLTQESQRHDLAVRKFQRIVVGRHPVFVDLPKDRGLISRQANRPIGKRVTSPANDNSVPGKTQTATLASPGAANPRVPVPKSRVVSLSPTFAGRDLT